MESDNVQTALHTMYMKYGETETCTVFSFLLCNHNCNAIKKKTTFHKKKKKNKQQNQQNFEKQKNKNGIDVCAQ